jgi:hypothetical protein
MRPVAVPHAQTFDSIRADVLDRLITVRESLGQNLGSMPTPVLRQEIDRVLDRMQTFMVDGDAERYRDFVARWVAYHLAEGAGPDNLVHVVVALGDVVIEVAKRRLPPGPASAGFVREVVRMSLAGARLIVDTLGAELAAMQARAPSGEKTKKRRRGGTSPRAASNPRAERRSGKERRKGERAGKSGRRASDRKPGERKRR